MHCTLPYPLIFNMHPQRKSTGIYFWLDCTGLHLTCTIDLAGAELTALVQRCVHAIETNTCAELSQHMVLGYQHAVHTDQRNMVTIRHCMAKFSPAVGLSGGITQIHNASAVIRPCI